MSIRSPRLLVFEALGSLVLALCTVPGRAGVGERPAPFDHGDWGTVLGRFVDHRGLVDYQALASDRATLDRYLAAIEATSPRSAPQRFPGTSHELAYWINAYNAHVFAGVLARGPETESVWTGGLISGRAFFVKRKIVVGGESMSLKELEDDVIRATYRDPRIHAALNCASLGCPRLPREPFEAEALDRQLDAAMRELVSNERSVAIDEARGVVRLSKIFDWFEGDFLELERTRGNESPSVIDYVNRYRAPGHEVTDQLRVEFVPYDKGLNSQ
ncbi:MAG TPA: DUF547 domain-containing protein [Thermoanaerobaculia bacterium]|nr:DUF547 domain-containing protein [Thermoanaerobaculia bacterium]